MDKVQSDQKEEARGFSGKSVPPPGLEPYSRENEARIGVFGLERIARIV